MKYCSACGAPVQLAVPAGEERPRHICRACGVIHYQNPRPVVGCLVEEDGRILLCRRDIEPCRGRWTLPAGYQELEESAVEGAARETHEEANAVVEVHGPHALLDIPHIGQAYLLFRARFRVSGFSAGAESQEVGLFDLDGIPWDELAFPVIRFALQLYREDRQHGRPRVHLGVVQWSREGSRFDWSQYQLRDHLALPVVAESDEG